MRITVTTLNDQIFNLEISEELELENFKAFCEVESGVSARDIILVHLGRPLTDEKKSLKDLGLTDGDVVVLQQQRRNVSVPGNNPSNVPSLPQFDFSSIQVPRVRSQSQIGSTPSRRPVQDPALIRDILLNDPAQLAIVEQNNPALAEALKNNDFDSFSRQVLELQAKRDEQERQRLRLLSANPFDAEAQRLIAEEIRQKNIDANMEAAMEHIPEIFGTVVMLYINCKVNGHPVKAFIDSGAQTTIMSTECAERCHIMHLVDQRFAGIAKGVGTQAIIGRVHMCQVQIGQDFLSSSFSILADQKMDMLLGLDMLKRHQCVIDLKKNVLVIGTTNTETEFLHEAELPDMARLSTSNGDDKAKES